MEFLHLKAYRVLRFITKQTCGGQARKVGTSLLLGLTAFHCSLLLFYVR